MSDRPRRGLACGPCLPRPAGFPEPGPGRSEVGGRESGGGSPASPGPDAVTRFDRSLSSGSGAAKRRPVLGLVVGVGREATMRREAISRIGVGAMTWRSTLVVGATTGAGAWRAIGRGDQAGCRSGGTHPASIGEARGRRFDPAPWTRTTVGTPPVLRDPLVPFDRGVRSPGDPAGNGTRPVTPFRPAASGSPPPHDRTRSSPGSSEPISSTSLEGIGARNR